ncbi:hypothetical protein [Clostridium niameyense]|uniref:hypothetical protein n=1 Tax=Clostridium niameyense TaxID=1622073 RepID=UPI00067F4FBF|nr:hypothetical protein [Clostridium niameyense]
MKFEHKIEKILNEYTTLINEIKNLELNIEEVEKDYKGIGAISYSEKTGQTFKINNSVEEEVINKEERIKYLKRIKRAKEIEVEKVNNALEVLNEKERRIIELKFFNERKKSWTNVSRRMDMCEAWCRNLKNRAIKKMIPVLFVEGSEKVAGK